MVLLKLQFLIAFFFCANLLFAQTIHYYGWDSLYHHYPSDIIETQNGDFFIVGNVNLTAPIVENYTLKKYLVRIDFNGDTVWTSYHDHSHYGRCNVIESANNDFLTLGNIGQNYTCGFIGQSIPFHDYCTYRYSSSGSILNTNVMTDNCENSIDNYLKNDEGGITTVQGSRNPITIGSMYDYTIKELLPNGQLLTIPFPPGLSTPGRIEKNINGYWLLQHDSLHRLDLGGNIVWQTANTYPVYINDFCKVNEDSFIIVASNPYTPGVGTTTVMKTDSFGTPDWTRTFPMKGIDVLHHSSGNYVITGTFSDDLRVIVVSPNGDSLWSRTHTLTKPATATKSIEASDGRIVTLAQAKPPYTIYNVPSQYVVVFDSLDLALTSVSIIDNIKSKRVDFYPNPTYEVLNVQMKDFNPSMNYTLEIYNSIGQLVSNYTVNKRLSTFNLSSLSSGIYFLKINSNKGLITQEKLVLNK
ncbi:T9SS type A sorting domain-containing protein [Aureispira sp. CCB-E]|uniref:T9SS type A sorting domain-containing protein n=1 Tax=Aureispira sp. CCB-E TaxID=3051121 RepID=UPI002868906E|nr:T9SS type A sorting domain-containing protein [Aureispira sp. CCB-E]WMX13118.1 T9SS type A sorting domain-containing protein [Aureispira sp. CCB-E]